MKLAAYLTNAYKILLQRLPFPFIVIKNIRYFNNYFVLLGGSFKEVLMKHVRFHIHNPVNANYVWAMSF